MILKSFNCSQHGLESEVLNEVSASYLEIYNERCRDLLRPDTKELKLRDSPEKGPFVQGFYIVCLMMMMMMMMHLYMSFV
jgi:hypothetical protein